MPNQWVIHVKNWSKRHNMTYSCAVSDPDCKSTYHAQKLRNAKKTRTPVQETKEMSAEDVDVPPPAKAKAKAKPAKATTVEKKTMPEEVGKLIQDFARPTGKKSVIALFSNYVGEDRWAITQDNSVLLLVSTTTNPILLYKGRSTEDAFDWVVKNYSTRERPIGKHQYTYNLLTGSEYDHILLDKYGLKLGNPSPKTKLIFYSDADKKSFPDHINSLAEVPYTTKADLEAEKEAIAKERMDDEKKAKTPAKPKAPAKATTVEKKTMPEEVSKLIQDFIRPKPEKPKPYQELYGKNISIERVSAENEVRERKVAVRKALMKNDDWFMDLLHRVFGREWGSEQEAHELKKKEMMNLTPNERLDFFSQYWEKLYKKGQGKTLTHRLIYEAKFLSNIIHLAPDTIDFVELEEEPSYGQRYADEPLPMKQQYWDERVSPVKKHYEISFFSFFNEKIKPYSYEQIQSAKKEKKEYLLRTERDRLIFRQQKEAEKKEREKKEAEKKEAKRLERNKKAREARLKKKAKAEEPNVNYDKRAVKDISRYRKGDLSFYRAKDRTTIYGKYDGKWYIIGKRIEGEGTFINEEKDFIAVPNYKFYDEEDGENITKTARDNDPLPKQAEPQKKQTSASKRVIDNFDLLKKISEFVPPNDGVESYKGYSASQIRDMTKKIFRGEIATRDRPEVLLHRFYNENKPEGESLGESYVREYRDRPEDEKEKILFPFLVQEAYREIDRLGEIEEWKKKQEKLLTEVKTVNVERKLYDRKDYIDRETNNVYDKYGSRWYYVGRVARHEWKKSEINYFDTYYYVPNYVFVENGTNITKKTKGTRSEPVEVNRAWSILEEMGIKKDQKKGKK